jgi:ubiquinone biosynthesis protein UbiJ
VSSENPAQHYTYERLLRLAEQLGACSRQLDQVAQQIAGLRERLEQIERSTEQAAPPGNAEV